MGDEEPVNKGLLVIPGINSSTQEPPFNEAIEYAKSQGFSVVRLDEWESSEDLKDETLENLHHLMSRGIEALEDHGCNYIGVIGKSFGGQLALTYPKNSRFEFMVLWAPAVSIVRSKKRGQNSKPLSNFERASEIAISREHLSSIKSPVKVIHGTEDQVVNIENSRKLANILPKAKLREVENVGHELESKKVLSATEGMLLFTDM